MTWDHLPVDATERAALLVDRPAGWEYLLFGDALAREEERVASRKRDYGAQAVHRSGASLDDAAALRFAGTAFSQWLKYIDDLEGLMHAAEVAWGAPGVAGNAEGIEQSAASIVGVQEDFLDWADQFREVRVRPGTERLFGLLAQEADDVAHRMQGSIAQAIVSIEGIPALLARKDHEHRTLALTITLRFSDSLNAAIQAEIRQIQADDAEGVTHAPASCQNCHAPVERGALVCPYCKTSVW